MLQKHFRTLEAIALDQPSAEEVNDLTVPDVERIEKRAGSLLEKFKELVYPPDYDAGKGTKRKVSANIVTCTYYIARSMCPSYRLVLQLRVPVKELKSVKRMLWMWRSTQGIKK